MLKYLFNLITVGILIVLLNSCNLGKGKFEVTGKLENAQPGSYIYLDLMTIKELVKVDSCEIHKNGSFVLKGKTSLPVFMKLYTSNLNYITLIVKPGDDIEITADANNLGHKYQVDGSYESQMIKDIITDQAFLFRQISDLRMIYQDSISIISSSLAEDKEAKVQNMMWKRDYMIEHIIRQYKEHVCKFIDKNPDTFASLMALYQQVAPERPLFYIIEDMKYFKKVDSCLFPKYPDSEAVMALNKKIIESKISAGKIKIGMLAPDFTLNSLTGDPVTLSSFRGKYVLLDIWASWNKTYREDNLNLMKNYTKYKDSGFEIVQVSLDKNFEAWTKAVNQDSLKWPQVSDLKMWESQIVSLYGIEAIPANYLLDPTGRVIDMNLRDAELDKALKFLFQKK
jgi:peroxiredoxin